LIEAEYAKMLTQAFDSRNDTDYDLMLMPNEEFAQAELDDANVTIVQSAYRCFKNGAN
jgi:uncharacterized protein (UPF0332 family)